MKTLKKTVPREIREGNHKWNSFKRNLNTEGTRPWEWNDLGSIPALTCLLSIAIPGKPSRRTPILGRFSLYAARKTSKNSMVGSSTQSLGQIKRASSVASQMTKVGQK